MQEVSMAIQHDYLLFGSEMVTAATYRYDNVWISLVYFIIIIILVSRHFCFFLYIWCCFQNAPDHIARHNEMRNVCRAAKNRMWNFIHKDFHSVPYTFNFHWENVSYEITDSLNFIETGLSHSYPPLLLCIYFWWRSQAYEHSNVYK